MNSNLSRARVNKKDEFYTLYEDIENELQYYENELKDKIIFCNTDNYKKSNFVKYFKDNFNRLELRKLYALDLQGNYFSFDGGNLSVTKLEEGDFRSENSIDILKISDVVITNPPFSLFREFVDLMFEYNKDFIIIGNQNALSYKNVFPLIMNGDMYVGYTHNKTMEFELPDNYSKWDRIEDGKKIRKVPISWYTTFEVSDKPDLELNKRYEADKYCTYDNYDIINVDKLKDIPYDYYGIMGVPITYINKHNGNQFEILGTRRWCKDEVLEDYYRGDKLSVYHDKAVYINGIEKYDRVFVRRKR